MSESLNMSEKIVVRTQAGANCEENDGIPPGLFVVTRDEWSCIVRFIHENKRDAVICRDCSNGGHGCVLEDDLLEVVNDADVVEEHPSEEIIKFVGKVGDDSMLDQLRAWIANMQSTVWVVVRAGVKDSVGVYASAADAKKAANKYEDGRVIPSIIVPSSKTAKDLCLDLGVPVACCAEGEPVADEDSDDEGEQAACLRRKKY
jgi:hypothetical protein